jgi:hypothetical protein
MRREAFDYLWAEHERLWTQFCILQTEYESLVAASLLRPDCFKLTMWAVHHDKLHEYRLLVANHRLALQLSTRGWDEAKAAEAVRARSLTNGAAPDWLDWEPTEPVDTSESHAATVVQRPRRVSPRFVSLPNWRSR